MIWLVCDRCGCDFKGLDTHTLNGSPVTVGFYRRYKQDGTDSIWAQYFRGIEEVVCRECIWEDEAYLEKYPHMRSERIRSLIIQKGIQ